MISVSLVDGQKKQNKKQTRLCLGEEEKKQNKTGEKLQLYRCDGDDGTHTQ